MRLKESSPSLDQGQEAAPASEGRGPEDFHEDIIYPASIPFVLVHVACLGVIWTGVTAEALALCFSLYLVRMFAITAGNHRYFAHRSYKTSRVGQFILAVLCNTAVQRGAVWWAAIHRHHHKHSDTEFDVHSPRHRGFFYSHVLWIFNRRNLEADYSNVPDLTRYPELMWLNRNHYAVPAVLGAVIWLWMGWVGLVVGFLWSTVLLYHGTFLINSLAHVHGRRRYVTGDDSRNNWWLALLTLGEGWHNNHHAYQSATRQGFQWYEIDVTYYLLKALSWTGAIWELRSPPPELVKNERRLSGRVVEALARQIAGSFPAERVAGQVREAWANTPAFHEVKRLAKTAQTQAMERLESIRLPELPHLPSLEDVRVRAREMWSQIPEVSMDDVAARAHRLFLQALRRRILKQSSARS